MAQRRIFFLHNPKAGGSSLRLVLKELVGDGSIAPVFSNAPNAHRSDQLNLGQYEGFDLYAGHYGYDVYRRLRAGHLLFTNFRDPVQRVCSLYRYWRNNVVPDQLTQADPRDVAVVKLAHDLSFSEFVRADNEDLRLYISNFNFRQLHSSGWQEWPFSRRAKWLVKWRVARMPWFYIAETPKTSMRLLERIFPEVGHIRIPRENESCGRAVAIDVADVQYLSQLNSLDYAIYNFAMKLQQSRASR